MLSGSVSEEVTDLNLHDSKQEKAIINESLPLKTNHKSNFNNIDSILNINIYNQNKWYFVEYNNNEFDEKIDFISNNSDIKSSIKDRTDKSSNSLQPDTCTIKQNGLKNTQTQNANKKIKKIDINTLSLQLNELKQFEKENKTNLNLDWSNFFENEFFFNNNDNINDINTNQNINYQTNRLKLQLL